jgi:hypothetical protein
VLNLLDSLLFSIDLDQLRRRFVACNFDDLRPHVVALKTIFKIFFINKSYFGGVIFAVKL